MFRLAEQLCWSPRWPVDTATTSCHLCMCILLDIHMHMPTCISPQHFKFYMYFIYHRYDFITVYTYLCTKHISVQCGIQKLCTLYFISGLNFSRKMLTLYNCRLYLFAQSHFWNIAPWKHLFESLAIQLKTFQTHTISSLFNVI